MISSKAWVYLHVWYLPPPCPKAAPLMLQMTGVGHLVLGQMSQVPTGSWGTIVPGTPAPGLQVSGTLLGSGSITLPSM